jgi:hypothetical protein
MPPEALPRRWAVRFVFATRDWAEITMAPDEISKSQVQLASLSCREGIDFQQLIERFDSAPDALGNQLH